jgi:GR25 family glycosyltransferase involved in LPS biosynthesis
MQHPVLLIGYNRPEYINRRLVELTKSNVIPKKVIISLDGIPEGVPSEEFNFDLVLLPFEVSIIRRKNNLGCSNHIILAVSEVLLEHRTCIVIEDDVVIGKSFTAAISKGLSIMENHENIGIVGAFSPFHKRFYLSRKNSWRLSPYFSAWGWGTTSNFWQKFKTISDVASCQSELENSDYWRTLSKRKRAIWLKRFDRKVWDYNVQYILFLHSLSVLLPTYRLIDNEGFADSRSTHTKHVRPWSLFGEGLCDQEPVKYRVPGKFSILKYFWSFIDSNLWAADGYFNSRARSAGIRTIFKKLLKIEKFK